MNTAVKSIAIIVAAGTGRRMGGTVKKQYLEIQERPVLFYTLRAFEKSNVDGIVIVTGQDEIDYVQNEIVDKYGIKKVVAICPGGKERYDSVYEGMKHSVLPGDYGKQATKQTASICEASVEIGTDENANIIDCRPDYVLVHDGVRPFIAPELINEVIETVKSCKACVVAVPVKDTIKQAIDGVITKTVDRSTLFQIQTPQAFDFKLLMGAYEKMYQDKEKGLASDTPAITDDAMLIEYYMKQKVHIVNGDYRNIKITTPEDLDIANIYVNKI